MTTSSTNYTGLYSGNVSGVIPNTAYGNANVVGLLAAGTDGGNTVSNVVATGTVTAGNVSTPTVYNNGMVTQGFDFVQMQYSNSVTLPVTPYDIGVGSWLYLDAGGGVFQSNTTGTLETVVLGNDGSVSATGNITTDGYFIGTFQGNISGNLTVPGSNTQVLYNNNGNAGASAGFTFNSASNVATVTGNIVGGNIFATTAIQVGSFISNGVGQFGSNVNMSSNGTDRNLNNVNVLYSNDIQTGSITANNASVVGNVSSNLLLVTGTASVGNVSLPSSGRVFGDFTSNAFSNARTVFQTTNTTANSFSIISAIPGANNTGNLGAATVMFSSANQANSSTFGLYTLGAESRLWSSNTGTGNVNNLTVTFGSAANLATTITPSGNISAVGNVNAANFVTSGLVSATGNVTGNYFIGNGSQLTGIAAGTYGNANVSNFLATGFGSNTISTTGNISAGNVLLGDLLGAGNVTATGNVTGNYIIGNGSQLTGLPAGYSNADVTTLLASFGSNSISTTGNVTAGNFFGNGAGLTSITGANVTGTVANATFATSAGTAVTVTGNAQANITSVGTLTSLSVTGNVSGGNILTGGIVSATGNITGNYFIGNGSQLTGITTSAAGANTQIQFNNGNAFAGNAAMTFDVSTGNVTLANLIVGTGNTGTISQGGNATKINTSNAWSGALASLTSFQAGQMIIGNGYYGNLDPVFAQPALRGAKVVLYDSANIVDSAGTAIRYAGLVAQPMVAIGNMVNGTSAVRGGVGALHIGGGSTANTWSAGTPASIVGWNQLLLIGQPNATVAIGNVTVTGGIASFASPIVYTGSNVGNLYGHYSQMNNTANTVTQIGVAAAFIGTTSIIPTNTIGYYMPGTANNYGFTSNSTQRRAANYYFLKNDDDVAQSQLGSLRAYHTFQAAGTTTGTWDINKSNGQVQAVSATGNITIGSYTNFVTTANDGGNNDSQTDTVTLIIEQGATPYTVTMPTGNAAIKYAGNVTTVSNVANSTTMVAITAYRTAANATGYLTTISPGFV